MIDQLPLRCRKGFIVNIPSQIATSYFDFFNSSCAGKILNQKMLDDFMRSSGASVVSERVQQIIMMGVDFYKSRVVEGQFSITNSLKVCCLGLLRHLTDGNDVWCQFTQSGELSMIALMRDHRMLLVNEIGDWVCMVLDVRTIKKPGDVDREGNGKVKVT